MSVLAPYEPALVILASRNVSNLEKVQVDLQSKSPKLPLRLLQLDLGDLKQVRQAAAELNGWDDVPTIDVLCNNAGLAGTGERKIVNGLEQQFLVNHLGHFLFTNLILGKIIKAAETTGEARIVNVSSRGHLFSSVVWDDINLDKVDASKAAMTGYGQSKTANILFSVALAAKLAAKNVKAYSLHPGSIWTGLVRDMTIEELTARGWADKDRNPTDSDQMKWKTISAGTSTHVVACFDPSISGEFPRVLGVASRHVLLTVTFREQWSLSTRHAC